MHLFLKQQYCNSVLDINLQKKYSTESCYKVYNSYTWRTMLSKNSVLPKFVQDI